MGVEAPPQAEMPRLRSNLGKTAGEIDRVLALGFRLVNAVEQFAVQFGDDDFNIALPPIAESEADQAQLRSVPPLYLAAELEQAGLVPAAELLSGAFVAGNLQGDFGEAGPLLVSFWKKRNERFAASERQAFFSRLFGDTSGPTLAMSEGANAAFEALMTNLCTVLINLRSWPALPSGYVSEVPVRAAAAQLADNLLPRSGGMAVFAARDLLSTIKASLAILQQKQVQRRFRAVSVWTAVGNIRRMTGVGGNSTSSHVTRGKAGMLVLAWLADSFSTPRTQQLVPPESPLPDAASSWLQATASLGGRLVAAKSMS